MVEYQSKRLECSVCVWGRVCVCVCVWVGVCVGVCVCTFVLRSHVRTVLSLEAVTNEWVEGCTSNPHNSPSA